MSDVIVLETAVDVPDGTERTGDGRVALTVTDAHRARFDALPTSPYAGGEATVTDLVTGERWLVWRDACGLGCFCAAAGARIGHKLDG